MKSFYRTIFLILFCTLTFSSWAQSIIGFVLDENNNPVSFAKVFVKNFSNTGAVTNLNGEYSFFLAEGNYEVMFSSLGFETQTVNVTIKGLATTKQDIYLTEAINELETVEVSKKKTNVGYDIVKKVMARRSPNWR